MSFLFRPATPAPTAFIRVFFILIVPLSIVVLKLKNETAPKTSWKYDGIGNPSAHEIKQVITTKRKYYTNLAIIFNPSNDITRLQNCYVIRNSCNSVSKSVYRKRNCLLSIFTHPLSSPRPGIIPRKYERLPADDKHTQGYFRQAVGYLPMGRAVSDELLFCLRRVPANPSIIFFDFADQFLHSKVAYSNLQFYD